jgi:hypothetical protein
VSYFNQFPVNRIVNSTAENGESNDKRTLKTTKYHFGIVFVYLTAALAIGTVIAILTTELFFHVAGKTGHEGERGGIKFSPMAFNLSARVLPTYFSVSGMDTPVASAQMYLSHSTPFPGVHRAAVSGVAASAPKLNNPKKIPIANFILSPEPGK